MRITHHMSIPVHGQIRDVLEMAGLVGDASVALARIARRHLKPRAPRPRNATLRPGVDTPLWLTLVATARPYLRRRGEKALLARVLGVHPARIHEFFISRTAAPDAERTLLLLQWLKAKQAGRSFG
jgi:hypothetical protein